MPLLAICYLILCACEYDCRTLPHILRLLRAPLLLFYIAYPNTNWLDLIIMIKPNGESNNYACVTERQLSGKQFSIMYTHETSDFKNPLDHKFQINNWIRSKAVNKQSSRQSAMKIVADEQP